MNTLTRSLPQGPFEAAVPPVAKSPARYWGQRLTGVILVAWASSFVIGFEAALTVLVFVGFGAAVLGLRRPSLGLLGIGMLCALDAPMSSLLLTGGLLRWNTFSYWLLFVMLLALPFLLRLKDPHTRLLEAFVLLMSLQLVVSPDRLGGIQHILEIVILLGLMVYFARESQDESTWYWLGMVVGILAGVGGLTYFLQIDRIPAVNPNAWAFFPLTGLFAICLAFPSATRRSQGQLSLTVLAVANLAVVNFVWILLSGSRGILLIAIICLIFLALAIRSMMGRIALFMLAGLLVLAVSAQFSSFEQYTSSRIGLLFNASVDPRGRTSGRSDLAVAGWYIFVDNPLGVGTGGFPSAYASLGSLGGRSYVFYGAGQRAAAHSGWIKTLVENGVLGVLLLASYALSFAIVGWRRGKRDRDLLILGFMTTVVFAVAFIAEEFQAKGLWMLAAGVTTLLHRNAITGHLRSLTPHDNSLGTSSQRAPDRG